MDNLLFTESGCSRECRFFSEKKLGAAAAQSDEATETAEQQDCRARLGDGGEDDVVDRHRSGGIVKIERVEDVILTERGDEQCLDASDALNKHGLAE